MSDEFIRKDSYESHIAEIRSLIAESEKHYRMMNEAADTRTQTQIAEIRGEVKEIRALHSGLGDTLAAYADLTNRRIDDLSNSFNRRFDRFLTYVGIAITACGAIVAGVQLYLAFKG